jgi:DNA-binding MarR family transcriptional regulator
VNSSDKRLVDLKLTRAGREIIDEMTEIAVDFEARFLQKIENRRLLQEHN